MKMILVRKLFLNPNNRNRGPNTAVKLNTSFIIWRQFKSRDIKSVMGPKQYYINSVAKKC